MSNEKVLNRLEVRMSRVEAKLDALMAKQLSQKEIDAIDLMSGDKMLKDVFPYTPRTHELPEGTLVPPVVVAGGDPVPQRVIVPPATPPAPLPTTPLASEVNGNGLPFPNYNTSTVGETLKEMKTMDDGGRAKLLDFELSERGKKRVQVVDALRNWGK